MLLNPRRVTPPLFLFGHLHHPRFYLIGPRPLPHTQPCTLGGQFENLSSNFGYKITSSVNTHKPLYTTPTPLHTQNFDITIHPHPRNRGGHSAQAKLSSKFGQNCTSRGLFQQLNHISNDFKLKWLGWGPVNPRKIKAQVFDLYVDLILKQLNHIST